MLKGTEEDYETPVFYCTKCFSMHILRGKRIGDTDAHILTCGDCGAGPKHLDITSLGRFLKLYENTHGHKHIAEDKTPYSDLYDVYTEITPMEITESEALTNGMRVGEKINRKLDD